MDRWMDGFIHLFLNAYGLFSMSQTLSFHKNNENNRTDTVSAIFRFHSVSEDKH